MLPYRKRRTRTKTRRIRRLEEEKNVSECVSTANRSSAFLISFFSESHTFSFPKPFYTLSPFVGCSVNRKSPEIGVFFTDDVMP